MLQLNAKALIGVLCGLALCASYGVTVTVAQTLSSPVTLSSSVYGQSFYLYNPGDSANNGTIVSPVEYTNSLTLVPWQSYNSTMQWTVTQAGSSSILYISAVSSPAAGCNSGTARWNAGKNVAVTTLCTPATSLYTTYEFSATGQKGTYYIIPSSNAAACVTAVNGVPTIPSTGCSYLAATQWQLVTISP